MVWHPLPALILLMHFFRRNHNGSKYFCLVGELSGLYVCSCSWKEAEAACKIIWGCALTSADLDKMAGCLTSLLWMCHLFWYLMSLGCCAFLLNSSDWCCDMYFESGRLRSHGAFTLLQQRAFLQAMWLESVCHFLREVSCFGSIWSLLMHPNFWATEACTCVRLGSLNHLEIRLIPWTLFGGVTSVIYS